ncbi:hypothetical protein DRJ48_00965 [Candidatus Woesearchaeota archaeon]|nr:hypothetical protein [Candidatus Woesearchaeota archaeon]RLE43441.1 MAG: hypothetical protein DRJ48_00965 [Candidatus Woesearchaeota archaeon]
MHLEQIPLGSKRLKAFVSVPWELYRRLDDISPEERANWRHPLNFELLGLNLPLFKHIGLMQPEHPYHQHSKVMHWVAWERGKPVGRIAASVNYKLLDKGEEFESAGFFGFFECINSIEISRELLDAAAQWLVENGCSRMIGPGGYSNTTHEPYQGVLVEGFNSPPSVELSYNPSYYPHLMESYGLEKLMDYVTYDFTLAGFLGSYSKREGFLRNLTELVEAEGITVTPLNPHQLEYEVNRIVAIYNQAWKHNWGFSEITRQEAEMMADSLKMVVDPELVLFAQCGDKDVAVLGCIPDPYQIIRPIWPRFGEKLVNSDFIRLGKLLYARLTPGPLSPHLRVMFLGVLEGERKKPLLGLMFYRLAEQAKQKGYQSADASLLLEHNHDVINLCKRFGGVCSKRYRIYQKIIS